jgi:hypothetical protein
MLRSLNKGSVLILVFELVIVRMAFFCSLSILVEFDWEVQLDMLIQ